MDAKKKTELLNTLEACYSEIEKMELRGLNQDLGVSAKNCLRKAYRLISEIDADAEHAAEEQEDGR